MSPTHSLFIPHSKKLKNSNGTFYSGRNMVIGFGNLELIMSLVKINLVEYLTN